MKNLVLDLGCGSGGWTDAFLLAGYSVLGVDIMHHPDYRGDFCLCDMRNFSGIPFRNRCALVVASPPCDQFTRHDLPWTRRRNPPTPDLSLVRAASRISYEAEAPLVLENVRGAQRWIGRAVSHIGPFFFGGTGVPALLPKDVRRHFKELRSGSRPDLRARIPDDIAMFFAALNWRHL